MKNKILNSLLIFILLFFICSSSFAATVSSSKTTMSVVDKSICEIKLKDLGDFKKELTRFDSTKKEVELTLTLQNTAKNEIVTKPVEVFLVLDNSNSMALDFQGKTKKQYVIETATSFVDSIFNYFDNPKIGIVSFSSIDTTITNSGSLGTESDAKELLELSNSRDIIKNTINSYVDNNGPYTNIEAGLSLAEKGFSDSTDSAKYVVLISDGVPNLCLNTQTTLEYSRTIADSTKNKLVQMGNKGYKIYSVLMGLNDSLTPLTGSNPLMIADGSRVMNYREYAQEIFGTSTNPTTGNFYYIDYTNLSDIVNIEIYDDITSYKDNSLKNIVIKDYFPREILENFNFEYVKSPNIGKVSTEVDSSDNSITWEIELLKEGEIATLSYKLTLKDEYNEEVINKIIPTNSKVDIDFETVDGKGNSNSDVSPKVKLVVETVKTPDNTVSKDPIPQTGIYNVLFVILISIAVVFVIIKIKRLSELKK